MSPQDALTGSSTAVAAISPTDAWLVGEHPPEGPVPMSKHWDGTSWQSVDMPQVGSADSLYGVTAVSSDDVWAAGTYDYGAHPLIMHWDGQAWAWVPAPDGVQGSTNVLYGISSATATDIWAVGFNDEGFVNSKPLIEHYDGVSWSVVDSPQLDGNDNILFAVSARGADDVWAVGQGGDSGTALYSLAEHWDGNSWSVVPTPDVRGRLDTFFGVDDVSSIDGWAAGLRVPQYADMTMAAHWDGSAWSLVKTPALAAASIGAVLEVDPSQVWATGSVYDRDLSNVRPLILRSSGCHAG